jgi:hypothetical protein
MTWLRAASSTWRSTVTTARTSCARRRLVEYRIATVLDKQLRPIEALIRYQLFLHQLELEKIRATGEAYGHLASAIAHARERVIVLERQTR